MQLAPDARLTPTLAVCQQPPIPGVYIQESPITVIARDYQESSRAVGRFLDVEAIDFELPDHEGHSWTLSDHLATGPVLLVFYRGDW